MALITRFNINSTLRPGIDAWFGENYNKPMEQSDRIFKKKKANLETEIVQLMPGFTMGQVKPEGEALFMDTKKQGWAAKFVIKTVAIGASVSMEAIKDNIYKQQDAMKTYGRGLSNALKRRIEADRASHFNQARNSNYPLGDGKSLVASDHPDGEGGTFSNLVEGDLSIPVLEEMVINVYDEKDHRGEQAYIEPKFIVVPTALKPQADKIMKSMGEAFVADNTMNWLKDVAFKGSSDPVVCLRYLTNPEKFFVVTDVPEGFVEYRKSGFESDIDYDFETKSAKMSEMIRYQNGATDPRVVKGN